jgi:hypothetical protein
MATEAPIDPIAHAAAAPVEEQVSRILTRGINFLKQYPVCPVG